VGPKGLGANLRLERGKLPLVDFEKKYIFGIIILKKKTTPPLDLEKYILLCIFIFKNVKKIFAPPSSISHSSTSTKGRGLFYYDVLGP